jgi:predicted DNA-binding ribbon-helix-helix protein
MSSDQGSERLGRFHNNGPNRAILLSRLIFLWRVRPDNVQGPTLPRKRRVISERCLLILFLYKWYEGSSHTEPEMKSLILKRSVVLRGHKTSISVEDAFWSSVKEIAASGQMSVSELISAIDSERHHGNLSSSIRLFVLNFYREQLLDRLDIRDKRKAIQRVISGTGGMLS